MHCCASMFRRCTVSTGYSPASATSTGMSMRTVCPRTSNVSCQRCGASYRAAGAGVAAIASSSAPSSRSTTNPSSGVG